MSTVLWANRCAQGEVVSDEEDKYALYKHSQKLDRISAALGLPPFSALCDSTDAQINLGQLEMPEGMESTNSVMARQGVWIEATEAVHRLQSLLSHIRANGTRFGLVKNDHAAVVAELEQSMRFAQGAAESGARFNLCVVL